MKLDSQVAVITGSGRGIGRAIALAYAREGAQLALAARSETELQETVSAVSELGAEAIAVRTDVTSQEDTERLAHRVVERFGRIDVLVNNAGNSGPVGPLHVNDIADWVNTINVNLTGTFLVCRAVIPVMLERSGERSSTCRARARPMLGATCRPIAPAKRRWYGLPKCWRRNSMARESR